MWCTDSARRSSIALTILIAALAIGVALALFAQKDGKFPGSASQQKVRTAALFQPAVAQWQFLESSTTPPTESACYAAGLRCFTPVAMQNAYNVAALYTQDSRAREKQ